MEFLVSNKDAAIWCQEHCANNRSNEGFQQGQKRNEKEQEEVEKKTVKKRRKFFVLRLCSLPVVLFLRK